MALKDYKKGNYGLESIVDRLEINNKLVDEELTKRDSSLVADFAGGDYRVDSNQGRLNNQGFIDLLQFTRNSTKTAFNRIGRLIEVGVNQPAFEYDPVTGEPLGISIHEQRTNLLLWSGDFTQETYKDSSITITPNYGDSPLGVGTSTRVQFSEPNTVFRKLTTSLLSGETATGSALIKGVKGETIKIDGLSNPQPSAFITLTGDWQYVYFTGVTDSNDSVNLSTYTGVTARDIEVAFMQLEKGSFPTPYIPTQGSQETRSYDTCIIEDVDQSDWWNPNECTFIAEFKVDGVQNQQTILGSEVDQRIIYNGGGSGEIGCFDGSTFTSFKTPDVPIEANKNYICAISITPTSVSGCINGNDVITGPHNGRLLDISRLGVGRRLSGSFLNGTIKQVLYIPHALPDEKLQQASTL
tara:strand:+ start:17231 stop:18466 length:1236 start_codon:yes stop_codon:yes gene_type:complete